MIWFDRKNLLQIGLDYGTTLTRFHVRQSFYLVDLFRVSEGFFLSSR